ncbi:cysteine-rich receptor-like protein kinase 8-like protein [Corchorus olitorius]|uniref:Cysteine-rich receptor-like protein kinase 8-like protein n=1 Tax=Corchorus olitorius TaxID=93759 RepID=A0A1R3KEZ8_9ROSI|nr:cysteine-rich receptor-like protein kinase 8-like protein [Corchorus olitorius]
MYPPPTMKSHSRNSKTPFPSQNENFQKTGSEGNDALFKNKKKGEEVRELKAPRSRWNLDQASKHCTMEPCKGTHGFYLFCLVLTCLSIAFSHVPPLLVPALLSWQFCGLPGANHELPIGIGSPL